MAGKIKPNGIEDAKFGTTLSNAHPAKFTNTGSSQKKKGSGTDTISSGPHGTTFTENSSHINVPSAAGKARDGKDIASSDETLSTSGFKTAGGKTASKDGSGGPEDRAYPLARQYEKSGKTDRTKQRMYR